MLIKGCLSDIEKQLDWYLKLFEESVLLNNDFIIDITITTNGRKVILVDKTNLKEIESLLTDEKVIGKSVFVMDEEIYSLFRTKEEIKQYRMLDLDNKPILQEIKPYNKTGKGKNKTERKITQTQVVEYNQKDDILNVLKKSECSKQNKCAQVNFDADYRIEDFIEESVRLSKPCVFGIKYLDDNLLTLFYRNSVYDKGSDTTFRHYLCQQPGTLVSYMYFKELSSLRYQFEQFGRKLRHNGQNILSRMQANQLVHYFTKCWL